MSSRAPLTLTGHHETQGGSADRPGDSFEGSYPAANVPVRRAFYGERVDRYLEHSEFAKRRRLRSTLVTRADCLVLNRALEDELGAQASELAQLVGAADPIRQDLLDRFLDPGARGYPSFHGVVSLCHLQGPLRSLRRPHFYSGFRTPPDHALRTVEPMKPWPSSSTRPTTFRLGTLVISSISIALASAYGSGPAPFIQTMAVVLMIGGPLVLVAAIPFAGSPRGTR